MTELSWRERTAGIAAAIACVAVVGVGLSLSIPLLSLEMERMQASSTLIGLNTAVAGVASIIVVPFVPAMAARFGVLSLLLAAIALSAACLVAFKLLFSLAWWFPIRFGLSAALGTLFALSEYWINAAAPPERRGLAMGVYATVLAAGFAIGPAILAFVGTEGWHPYAIGAALFLTAAMPVILARGVSPSVDHGRRRSVLSFLMAAPAATLAAFVFGAVETGGFALLPVYGVRIGLSPEHAAALVSAVALGSVVFQIPIGLLADRVDRRTVLFGASALATVGAALIPVGAAHGLWLGAVLFLWGGVGGALYTVGLAHLGGRFTGAELASANAAFLVLYNVGLIVGPLVAGGAMDAWPPHGFAWALAALFLGYALLVGLRRGSAHA